MTLTSSGLKAVDELTLEVTLTDPMADFPAVCCHPGLPLFRLR
ncbi:MAG: hypothetical protein ACLTKG_06825 [Collinsella intestinalis]